MTVPYFLVTFCKAYRNFMFSRPCICAATQEREGISWNSGLTTGSQRVMRV